MAYEWIAQGVQPPQVETQTQAAGKALTLRALADEGQMRQLQMRQAQQDFADQQTMRQAYMQSGGDMDKFQQIVMQRGVSPKAIQQIQMQRLTMQKELAGLDETKLKNEKAKNDAFGSESAALLQITDPDRRQQYYQQVTKPRLTQMGVQVPDALPAGDEFLQLHANSAKTGDQLFTEEMKRREDARAAALAGPQVEKAKAEALTSGLDVAGRTVDQNANQDQYTAWRAGLPASVQSQIPPMYSPAAVEMVKRMGIPMKDQPEYDIKARQADAMKSMKPEDWDAQVDHAIAPNGDTQQLNARTKALVRGAIGMGLPLTAVQAVIKDASDQIGKTETGVRTAKATAPIKIEIAKDTAAVRAATPTVPGVPTAPTKLTGEDYLKTLPPAFAARVKAISEGRDGMPSGRAGTTGAGLQISNAVYQYDPSFTTQRAQIRKAFTSGPDGKNIAALNTAIVHLGRLSDTAEALNNHSFTPTNELYNYFKDKFGSATVTNFGLLKDAVAGEMAAALKGNATDIEIEKMGKKIRDINSPEQMAGVVQEGMGILADKANTYNERYHALVPDDPWNPILPSAKMMLNRHQVQPAGAQQTSAGKVVVTDPRGVKHTFPNQQSADAFKKAANLQ